jgi:hypothetical protein
MMSLSQSRCGALSKSTGKPCQNVAGKGTDHVGQGRCGHHGGATPIKHGLYSKIRRGRLGRRMAEIQDRTDLLDLHQELAMLKVILEQFITCYQNRTEALERWHRATTPAFKTLLESNDAAQIREAILAMRAAEPRRPHDFPDIVLIATLIDKIARTSERIYKNTTVCTQSQLQRILDQLGAVVAEHVDETANEKILNGWRNIVLEGQ